MVRLNCIVLILFYYVLINAFLMNIFKNKIVYLIKIFFIKNLINLN